MNVETANDDRLMSTLRLLDLGLKSVLEEEHQDQGQHQGQKQTVDSFFYLMRGVVLDLLYERYRSCDGPGLDALIQIVQFYGFDLTDGDRMSQLMRCPSAVIEWWLESSHRC